MAYTSGTLSALQYEIGGRARLWIYTTADSLTTVLGAGYVSDAGKKRIQLGDLVLVFSGTLNANLSASPTLVAAGITGEFSAAPSVNLCVVSSISSSSSSGVPALSASATLAAASLPLASGYANFRNLIDGGDFTTNPWQRGTSFSGIAATVTYAADRFFVVGADASVSAKAAKVAFSSVAGFNQAFRFGRTANASSLSAITAGQILETADSIRAQGQQVTLSFWAASEANYSGGNLTAQIVQGNGTDQSAASAAAATWTAQTNVINASQPITSTMTRYSFTGTVSSATTQLGLLLSYTPTGSAGAADSVLIEGVQLEVGAGPTAFEHRDVEVELALCQRYAFVVNEPTSGVIVGAGQVTSANKLVAMIPLPTPMRTAPSVTVTAGSFVFNIQGTATTATGLAAGATHTVNMVNLVASATGASGIAAMLQGGAGTGSIVVSAEY